LDWKRLLKIKPDKVLGLDIGSSAVKIVMLRKNITGFAVTAAGIAEIPNETENDKERKEISTVRAINKCIDSAGIQTQLAVCSVCGPEVAVRCFKFPELPQAEIHGAVQLEAEQVCPFNINNSAVDYQLIPDGENNITGVLVAATNEMINEKEQLAENASLKCTLMDVDGLALLNCFNSYAKTKAGQTIAILNVGSSYTNLAIMGDDSLPFVRDMAYAGNDIIRQIAVDNDISTETVSKILTGCEDSNTPQIQLADSLKTACQKLIVDVTKTLRYYTAQQKSTTIDKIFVCGGFALAKGFIELLDDQLPTKAVLWNPFDEIRCDADRNCRDILQKNGPAMAVAAGLAMRSI